MYQNNIQTTLGVGYGVGTPVRGATQLTNWPSQYPNPGYYLIECRALIEWNTDFDNTKPNNHDFRWPIQELVHVVSVDSVNKIAHLEESVLYDHPQYKTGYLAFMVNNPLVNVTVTGETHANALFQYIYGLEINNCEFTGDPIPCNIVGCRNVRINQSMAVGILPNPYPKSNTNPWDGLGIPQVTGHGYLFAPQNCVNVTIANCTSRNGRYGVSIFGGSNITINNHKCYNTVTDVDMHGNYAMDIVIENLLSGGVYPHPQNCNQGPTITLGNTSWQGAPQRVKISNILPNAHGDSCSINAIGMPWNVFPSTQLLNVPQTVPQGE